MIFTVQIQLQQTRIMAKNLLMGAGTKICKIPKLCESVIKAKRTMLKKILSYALQTYLILNDFENTLQQT